MWSIWQDSLPVLQSCTCLWAYSKLNNFCPESNKPPPDLKRQMISCCLLVDFSVQLRCRNLLHPLLISTEVRETNHQICFLQAERISGPVLTRLAMVLSEQQALINANQRGQWYGKLPVRHRNHKKTQSQTFWMRTRCKKGAGASWFVKCCHFSLLSLRITLLSWISGNEELIPEEENEAIAGSFGNLPTICSFLSW